MIHEYQKFRLVDKSKKNDLLAEVNYNEESKNCKTVKFTLGDKVAYIDKKFLNAMLFVIGKPSEQRKMIPQTIQKVRHYETVLGIKATKNIRKGEMINVPVSISLPSQAEEAIADISKKIGVPKKEVIERIPKIQ